MAEKSVFQLLNELRASTTDKDIYIPRELFEQYKAGLVVLYRELKGFDDPDAPVDERLVFKDRIVRPIDEVPSGETKAV